MRHEIVEVTPDLATAWLEANTHNRPIRDAHVDALARDMMEGRWRETGDPVRRAKDGTLLDGQHRLWAVVHSGVTVRLLVVSGLEADAQDYIDVGLRRTVGDALVLSDTLRTTPTNARRAATIARGVLVLTTGLERHTHAEVLAFVRANFRELDAAVYVQGTANTNRLPGGAIHGIAFYLLAGVDREAARDFFEQLTTGLGLDYGSPVAALRTRLLRLPGRVSTTANANRLREHYTMFVKAWNAYRTGRNLQVIRVSPNDPIPTPV